MTKVSEPEDSFVMQSMMRALSMNRNPSKTRRRGSFIDVLNKVSGGGEITDKMTDVIKKIILPKKEFDLETSGLTENT